MSETNSLKKLENKCLDDITEEVVTNEDGSITKIRSRKVLDKNGVARTEISSETHGSKIKLETDINVKKADTKYNSEEVSVVKKGGKEITTRYLVLNIRNVKA
jgi:hypothetical protein